MTTRNSVSSPSPNDTVAVSGSTGSIVDASGNVWTITGGGQVAVNGVTDTGTANIALVATVGGTIWTENAGGLWSARVTPADAPSATSVTVPLTVPYNINAIAGSASTDGLTSLDYSDFGGDAVLMTQTYADQFGASGLPAGFGATGSTGDNVLQLGTHGQSQNATLAVASGNYTSVDILALGVDGGDQLTVSLDYADGTTTSSQSVPDWLDQGSLNRFSLAYNGVDDRGFGYGDFSFAADPSKVLTDVQVASASGRIDILGATGNQTMPAANWSAGSTTSPLDSASGPPNSYSGTGTVFETTKPASVSIGLQSYDGGSFETTELNGPWNLIKSVQTAPTTWSPSFSGNLAYDNFVETKLDFRAADQANLDVMAIGAKRGSVMLDDGADKFTWVANSNDDIAALNRMTVHAGGGNDTIDLTATGLSTLDDSHTTANGSLWNPDYQGANSIAQVYLGAGSDTVTVTGATRLFLYGSTGFADAHGGSGADTMIVGAGGGDFTGGGGADMFVFAQGSGHATIEDFTSGLSKLDFTGMTNADISQAAATESGVAGLRVTYDSAGDNVFLAHASKIAASDMIFT